MYLTEVFSKVSLLTCRMEIEIDAVCLKRELLMNLLFASYDVNDYRSSSPARQPMVESLSRPSSSESPQSSSADVGDTPSCADNDPSCIEQRAVTKRQVDPLHSCIEAKCSSWNSGNYLDCVYRQCVTGFQMHGKRSTDTDEPTADTFANPEGRFLLLPVTFQNSGVEPQLFPENILQSDEQVDEVRRALTARARLARRRMSASREDEHRGRTARGNKQERRKRAAVEWNGSRSVDRIGQSGSLAAALRASLLPKRSYNDIADVCVEHHCGEFTPHTISYFQCVQHHCTGKRV